MNDAQRLAALLLEDDGAWDFTSRIDGKNVDVQGEPEGWYLMGSMVEVKWSLEFEVRDWGVKEFNPSIREVSVLLNYEVTDPATGEVTGDEQVELHYPSAPGLPGQDVKAEIDQLAQVQATAQWQTRGHEEYSPSVFPKDVEIDLSTHQITVFF